MAHVGDKSSSETNHDSGVRETADVDRTTSEGTEKKTSADNRQSATLIPSSVKNRRKIRQPKQYKPRPTDIVESSHSAVEESPDQEVKESKLESQEKELLKVVIAEEVSQQKDPAETTVHVMTASTSPKQKTIIVNNKTNTKSTGKKSTGKNSGGKKTKPQSPPTPMRPEDLIKTTSTNHQLAGGRRDAQYRKSYAYKIWKERSNCALTSEQEETMKPEEKKQAGKQTTNPVYYNPPGISTGFYANGKYYEMTPPQRIGSENKPPTRDTTEPNQAGNTAVAQYHAKNITNVVKLEEYPTPLPSKPPPTLVEENAVPGIRSGEKPKEESTGNKSPSSDESNPKVHSEKQTTPVANSESEVKVSRIQQIKENIKPALVRTKRKLEIEKGVNDLIPATKKPAKSTIFTPLNEQEAERLANDIYDVNLEYFPIQTLAEKAAHAEGIKDKSATAKTNKAEIEKVRCLLKDFYDVTRSCAEDPDMQKFDSASRKFGRKNILNHLSLLDRYFAELEKRMDDKDAK